MDLKSIEQYCREKFSYLEDEFGFELEERSSVRKYDRESIMLFEKREISVCLILYSPGRVSVELRKKSEDNIDNSEVVMSRTLEELLRIRSPENSGWHSRKEMPPEWPRSSNLNDSNVVLKIIELQAKLLRKYGKDILGGDFSLFPVRIYDVAYHVDDM
ncbi:MAG: hypothetical protein HON04_09300 [Planctomicrobium sp.]|jgi:hypothetical protein|nr:hypothetical protein [Planctomicrobium sp.]